jgi:nitroreductase
METWDAIRARRNVRQYTQQPIAREDLERICEAGRRAPSTRNWQPWNFVVVTEREQLIELAQAWPQGGQHIARAAAAIALVASRADDEEHHDWVLYDFGQVTMTMMIAAADLGIGSGHSSVRDKEQAQRALGLPDGYFAVYMMGLGYPDGRPLRPVVRPDRRPFDEVVHWGHWESHILAGWRRGAPARGVRCRQGRLR